MITLFRRHPLANALYQHIFTILSIRISIISILFTISRYVSNGNKSYNLVIVLGIKNKVLHKEIKIPSRFNNKLSKLDPKAKVHYIKKR